LYDLSSHYEALTDLKERGRKLAGNYIQELYDILRYDEKKELVDLLEEAANADKFRINVILVKL
jgi:hypothetical protein